VSLPTNLIGGVLLAAIVSGYLIGLAIIALVPSPTASPDTTTNPVYLIAVTVGSVAFARPFL